MIRTAIKTMTATWRSFKFKRKNSSCSFLFCFRFWFRWLVYSWLIALATFVCLQRSQRFRICFSTPDVNTKTSSSPQPESMHTQVLPDSKCGCRAETNVTENTTNSSSLVKSNAGTSERSTCSQRAGSRGLHQRVLSFSLFGRYANFLDDLERNVQDAKSYYPGYVMRVYHDVDRHMHPRIHGHLCRLACQETHLDLCDVRSLETLGDISQSFGMIWRFAPMADPLVDEWHSRDLDSRLSAREVSAVDEWLSSGEKFHVMRDHPQHGVPMAGGLFGMAFLGQRDRKGMRQDFGAMLQASRGKWAKGLDQILMDILLYDKVEVLGAVIHDSYFCRQFRSQYTRPFPTQRESGPFFASPGFPNFVGSNGGLIFDGQPDGGRCPEACRPKLHHDWLLC